MLANGMQAAFAPEGFGTSTQQLNSNANRNM